MLYGTHHTKESLEKMSKSNKGKHYSPRTEFKKGQTPWNKGRKGVYSEETLKKMGKRRAGKAPWNKGKKGLTVAWNKGRSKLPLNKLYDLYWKEGLTLEEIAEKYGCEATLVLYWMKRFGIIRRDSIPKFVEGGIKTRFKKGSVSWNKGRKMPEGFRKKVSEGHRGQIPWNKGKPMSEKHLRNWFKSVEAKPNRSELRLLSILQRIDPNWRYVGDGSLIIAGKCPDFSDGNGHLVELYGDFWHKDDDPQERIDFFKERGYDCTVVWERELEGEGKILGKVQGT